MSNFGMNTKVELPEEKSSVITSVDEITAQFDAVVRVSDLDLQTITINGEKYYALKKKGGLKKPPVNVRSKSDERRIAPKIEPKKEPTRTHGAQAKGGFRRGRKTGPYMLAGPPHAGGLPGMASFSSLQNQNSMVENHSLDSIHNVPTNVGSPQSSSSFNPNSPSTSSTNELANLHNFDSVTAGNDLDALLTNLEPSLTVQDFVAFEEPTGALKRHRDDFIAQNAIANGSNLLDPSIPANTQAAILHEVNNPGPSCSKKRKFDNKDDEFISSLISPSDIDMIGLHGDNTTGGPVSQASEIQYADSTQQEEASYFYISDENIVHQDPSAYPIDNQYPNQGHQSMQPYQNNHNQSEDVVLELVPDALTEAKDVFVKKEIFAQKNEKERNQAAKILIDAGKVEQIKLRDNAVRGEDRPYQCILCPIMGKGARGFKNNEDLYRHHCQHLSHKPIVCEQCKEGFYRKDHLNRHMKNQHGVTVEKRVRAANGTFNSPPSSTQRAIQAPANELSFNNNIQQNGQPSRHTVANDGSIIIQDLDQL